MSQGAKAPILVIEDDVGIRGNLTELLQEYGFGVVSSDNGLDGIALARELRPGRAIHSFSPRKAGPFVALNCAALSESLVLSELFGYEKGAFTGALQSRAGLLESASGGTLFLDEVGELPLSMQSKLLRVIEEKKVMRVGARTEREVDVRLVAATNRDLDEEVAAGRFRQDLYFRLNGVSLTVPPLRERREEIRPLASMFLARALGSLQAPPLSIDEATFEVLERYPFPGNVRELKNLIERGAALCRGRVLPAFLPHLGEVSGTRSSKRSTSAQGIKRAPPSSSASRAGRS